jgi:hypothetical protein
MTLAEFVLLIPTGIILSLVIHLMFDGWYKNKK